MTYLHTGITSPSEKICVQITTGCAAHVSYDRALLNAILEVVERDALSITWLQQLPLPRIEIDSFSSPLGEYWDRYQKCSEDLTYAFFDATTDLEIPTVYGLQISPTDKRLTTLVSCASAMTPALAVIKVMREMEALRIAFRNPPPVPQDCDDYTELMHGATFMARAEQADKFDFLLRSGRSTALSNIPSLQCSDEKEGLRTILERFRHKRLDVYAVDLSTDEALRSGVRVVRVIIPGLQPFSFKYRAQYLGHPRLYEAPKKMRHRVRKEAELNPWPQPFA
jgi:ribosomal protein S12 methylthiotransferase accessory factor